MTRIKICGIQDIETAIAASISGADFLGLVFASSKRQISPGKARQIVGTIHNLEKRPEIVGVFVNAPLVEVNRVADYCLLDRIQLSGDEDWDYCQNIRRPLIKAFHISLHKHVIDISAKIKEGYRYIPSERLIYLLDSRTNQTYGGTGTAFDWQIAKALSADCSLMIAGGLTPSNVRELIKDINPWGVDVSSGVETNGKKDIEKIRAFIQTVKRANTMALGGDTNG